MKTKPETNMVAELQPELVLAPPPEALTRVQQFAVKQGGVELAFVVEQQQEHVDAYDLIVPGFYGIHAAYTGLRHYTALQDPNVGAISMHPPRRASLWRPGDVLPKAVWGVTKAALQETGVASFSFVGHSMGGAGAINAAEFIRTRKDPDLVKSVIINGGAGVTNHNLFNMGPRSLHWLRQELLANRDELGRALGKAAFREIISYSRHRQTVYEMLDVCRSNILDKISSLHDAGVFTGAVYFEHDPFFDAERAQHNLRGRVDAFTIMPGIGHTAPQLRPAAVAAANHTLRQASEKFI